MEFMQAVEPEVYGDMRKALFREALGSWGSLGELRELRKASPAEGS